MSPEAWEDAAAEEAERRAAILEERYEARRAATRRRLTKSYTPAGTLPAPTPEGNPTT